MRQWKVDPRWMCRQHLLGEHLEHHMMAGTILRGISIQGYIDGSLFNMNEIYSRHDELVKEMLHRGYNHKSPLPAIPPGRLVSGSVDIPHNTQELLSRCKTCRKNYKKLKET